MQIVGFVSFVNVIELAECARQEPNVTTIISQLEKEMYNHAKNLEFEQAAKIRDQINELQEKYLMFPKVKSGAVANSIRNIILNLLELLTRCKTTQNDAPKHS